nr:MAG TPA: hypothetical protein [Caudoviricetes sp.]
MKNLFNTVANSIDACNACRAIGSLGFRMASSLLTLECDGFIDSHCTRTVHPSDHGNMMHSGLSAYALDHISRALESNDSSKLESAVYDLAQELATARVYSDLTFYEYSLFLPIRRILRHYGKNGTAVDALLRWAELEKHIQQD